MKEINPVYNPLQGKTYSLFGNKLTTDNYYQLIDKLTDCFFAYYSPEKMMTFLKDGKIIKNVIRVFFNEYSWDTNSDIHEKYNEYTPNVSSYIHNLPFTKRLDKTIGLKEKQYHYYMLEAEIINRLNKENFNSCEKKLALLPHCLRDSNKNCKAVSDGTSLKCKHCQKNCFINYAYILLEENGITPYIWSGREEQNSFQNKMKQWNSTGVLGIACIPELINGMRRFIKKRVPVVGIPLNANRCRRWMGESYENSFDTERLFKLINYNEKLNHEYIINSCSP